MPENNEHKWSPLEWLWDKVSGFFEAQFQKVWTEFTGIFWGLLAKILNTLFEWFDKIEDGLWDGQLKAWRNRGWIDKDTEDDLKQFKKWSFPINIFVFLVSTAGMISNYIGHVTSVVSSDLRRRMFSKYHPEDARPEQILQAAFIAPEKTDEIRQVLLNTGLSEQQIDLMFLSMYRLYDEETIRVLYLRKAITKEKMFERMRELGYTDTRIQEIVKSWPVIPGPADLFHLVAKEAFEPDMIEHYGYDDEFPEKQLEYVLAQGLSEEWARRYWYAHWETPSIEQGFEMLHRGVIDFKELDDLFRTVEIPPFWRDKLTKIAYMPYTRVDTRRMHDMKVLSEEELIAAYKDQGYDDERALKMAQFTVKYNKQHDKDLTKSEILTGFREHLISHEDAHSMLVDMEYDDNEAEYLLAYEQYKINKKLQEKMISGVERRFVNNIIDEFEARNRLGKLNLDGITIDILIDEWKLDRIEDIKQPSKTDLDKFLKAGIINDDEYRDNMRKLGYINKHIDWYRKLVGELKLPEIRA